MLLKQKIHIALYPKSLNLLSDLVIHCPQQRRHERRRKAAGHRNVLCKTISIRTLRQSSYFCLQRMLLLPPISWRVSLKVLIASVSPSSLHHVCISHNILTTNLTQFFSTIPHNVASRCSHQPTYPYIDCDSGARRQRATRWGCGLLCDLVDTSTVSVLICRGRNAGIDPPSLGS